MKLELDCGNTKIKWRLLTNASVVRQGSFTQITELNGLIRQNKQLRRAAVCSVRGDSFNSELKNLLHSHNLEIFWAATKAQQAGVRCGYDDYSGLGIDRWLVILATWRRFGGSFLVIDCGTALTADFVDCNGQHLGGAIAPGVAMLRNSLTANTELNASVQAAQQHDLPATNTAQAISLGIAALLKGFAGQQTALAEKVLAPDYKVVLTGGDADEMSRFLPQAEIIQGLVFEGLQLAEEETLL